MITQQLIDYISKELSVGKAPDLISQELLQNGWNQSDISMAFSELKKVKVLSPSSETATQSKNSVVQIIKRVSVIILKIILFVYGLSMGLSLFQGLVKQSTSFQYYEMFNSLISIPSLVALYLWVFNKRLVNIKVWRVYSIIFIPYDIIHNLIILPLSTKQPLSTNDLVGGLITFPIYIILLVFSFRKLH